jgi:drug/metabolite transporter (DMT)-like permease
VIGLFTGFAGILVIVASEPSSGGSHVVEGAVVPLGALGWAGADSMLPERARRRL